mmetsp:Transcript_44051/g.140332  ORF Transcript_44051/g.140332 Transcript_44051/m.140332 type:complete len:185 (-) Transcript_44051:150-704(-)
MDKDYRRALAVSVAVLVLKVTFVTAMTVRNRLSNGKRYSYKEESTPVMNFLYAYVFKAFFCVCPLGPDPDPEDGPPSTAGAQTGNAWVSGGSSGGARELDKWLNIHRNATEQEPWFMGIAVVYGLVASSPDPCAAPVLYIFAAFRWLHMVCFALHLQPFRTFMFAPGLVCNIILSVLTLIEAFR